MIDHRKKSDFTVLMAVYYKDNPDIFRRSLDSIYSNTLQPKSVVLVADGALVPELEDVLKDFCTLPGFVLLRLEKNSGLAAALNYGLSTIQTEYTVRADSDDINHHNRFFHLLDALNGGFDLVGSSILEVDVNGDVLALKKSPISEVEIKQYAKKRNPFNHMSVGFRTSVVVRSGGYPCIHLKEDYGLWATLLSRGARVCNLDMVLVNATTGRDMYRRRGGFRYATAEIEIQRHLIITGIKSKTEATFDGLLRAFVFILPSRIRELIYINLLRSN